MARDMLSIPVTSVLVERPFSSLRDILPYRYNRMGHEIITALIVAKSWDNQEQSTRSQTKVEHQYM